MSNYEATKYDFSGASLQGLQGVNTGIIVPWSDTSTPSGFLTCDGSAVSRSTYADLFAVVGTNYGVGDGSTTFNLPDLTDRTAVGKSPTKAQFTTGGANVVTSTGNVAGSSGNTTLSTAQLPVHTHPQPGAVQCVQNAGNQQVRGTQNFGVMTSPTPLTGSAGGGGAHAHNATGNFTGDSTSVLQPYVTIKYIIKT